MFLSLLTTCLSLFWLSGHRINPWRSHSVQCDPRSQACFNCSRIHNPSGNAISSPSVLLYSLCINDPNHQVNFTCDLIERNREGYSKFRDTQYFLQTEADNQTHFLAWQKVKDFNRLATCPQTEWVWFLDADALLITGVR
jgi:hypothetical protein